MSIYPKLSPTEISEIESNGEALVYRAMEKNLSDQYTVLFQASWILKSNVKARDGEIDFLIFSPTHGCLCIEVKGGGIERREDSLKWFSTNRDGLTNKIKNPFEQATSAKSAVKRKIKEHPDCRALKLDGIQFCHGVFFPDICGKEKFLSTDSPIEIIGDSSDLEDIEKWIEQVFSYWAEEKRGMSQAQIEILRKLFARSASIPALLAGQLKEERKARLKITKDQAKVLDFIQSHRRSAISGGAGTGKTVLAIEKARRLAREGFKTLLTCYNRPLAEQIKETSQEIENLEVLGFHELCTRYLDQAKSISGRDCLVEASENYPGADKWDILMPNALSFALDEIEDRFDAIVCDEGQDFAEEWWFPIELLLADYENSPLYVFFDENQNIYKKAESFPIKEAPFSLTTNCRNTQEIHAAAYKFYKGPQVHPPSIKGRPIEYMTHSLEAKHFKSTHNKVLSLLNDHEILPNEIVVLHADGQRKHDLFAHLSSKELPNGFNYILEGIPDKRTILVDSVARFKGLESQFVILLGLDQIDNQSVETFYTALSRAKFHLIIVGNQSLAERFSDQS